MNVVKIFATKNCRAQPCKATFGAAFVALKKDRTAVAWGDAACSEISMIRCTSGAAFAMRELKDGVQMEVTRLR